jgi:hypothetical protein
MAAIGTVAVAGMAAAAVVDGTAAAVAAVGMAAVAVHATSANLPARASAPWFATPRIGANLH